MKKIMIQDMSKHLGETIKLGAWLANKRSSGKIAFLQLRDGSGFVQGVVVKEEAGEELFAKAKSLTQETSMYVIGEVTKDERSTFGYELQVKDIEVIHEAVDFPITPKEHGTEFLMDNRHLWLRSRKQHAIMKIRNELGWKPKQSLASGTHRQPDYFFLALVNANDLESLVCKLDC